MTWTLVTGGAKRLGAHICRALAQEGHSIIVHYNTSKQEASEVVAECRKLGANAELLQGNFSQREDLEAFADECLKRFGSIKYLVNNVGNFLIRSALETDFDSWQNLFQVNLHAPFVLTKRLMPSVIANSGSVVNIGYAGLEGVRGDVYCTAYTLTKTALWLLTKSLAKEVAPSQVSINMVSPGKLDIWDDLPHYSLNLPMQRPGTCDEVATVVAFLLKEENRYITGQNIDVAGGVKL